MGPISVIAKEDICPCRLGVKSHRCGAIISRRATTDEPEVRVLPGTCQSGTLLPQVHMGQSKITSSRMDATHFGSTVPGSFQVFTLNLTSSAAAAGDHS